MKIKKEKSLKGKFSSFKIVKYCIWLFILGLPAYLPLRSLKSGMIPHWFDTARELLSGLENLEKIRLVGNQGGIPGIFYGPHWTWLVSLVQIFNKDPVVITTFVLFIPYFVLLPFLFYKLKPVFGTLIIASLWLIFILKYNPNSVHLWHIHLAPVIFLGLIYTLISINWPKITRFDFVLMFLAGFLASFLIFIHMSFGSVIFLAVCIYFGINILYAKFAKLNQKKVSHFPVFQSFGVFISGFILCSSPFIIFELRHGFLQTKTIVNVLTQSFVYHSAVVGQVGLSQAQIWDKFIALPIDILQLPHNLVYTWWFSLALLVGYWWGQNKLKFSLLQKHLLLLLGLCILALFVVYILSKNPIREYQFLGTEIIVILLIGLLAAKSRIFAFLILFWVSWIYFSTIRSALTVSTPSPLSLPTLNAKKYIVESIYQDASHQTFGVFAYSSAIYTFDYDYLFKWLGQDIYHFEPKQTANENIVYLIIPNTAEAIKVDFIHYRTPDMEFKTEKEWQIPEGTSVVKRIRINKI